MKLQQSLRLAMMSLTLLAGTGVQAQTASAADWAKVMAGAKTEGKVVLYASASPAQLASFKTGFEAAYPGIQVEYTRLTPAQVPNAIDKERETKVDGADVIITQELVWVNERLGQNAFTFPSGPAAAKWPAAYMIGGRVPMLVKEPLVLVYNTDLIKDKITGYADLLKPQYKGKLGIVEINAAIVGAFYDWLEQTQGKDFLPKVAAQNPRFYVGAVPLTQAVASGEVAFSNFTVMGVAAPMIRQGAPMRIVVPSPSVGTPYLAAVVSNSRRPNAGLLFLDYQMTPAGQALWAGSGDMASPIGVPGSLDINTITLLDQAKYPSKDTPLMQAKWARTFKK